MVSPCRNGLDSFQLLQMLDKIIFRPGGGDVEFFNHHILDLMEAPFPVNEFPDASRRFIEGIDTVEVTHIVPDGNENELITDLSEDDGITLEIDFCENIHDKPVSSLHFDTLKPL